MPTLFKKIQIARLRNMQRLKTGNHVIHYFPDTRDQLNDLIMRAVYTAILNGMQYTVISYNKFQFQQDDTAGFI